MRADALSKLASTSFDQLTKKVFVEVLTEMNIDKRQIDSIVVPPDWTKALSRLPPTRRPPR